MIEAKQECHADRSDLHRLTRTVSRREFVKSEAWVLPWKSFQKAACRSDLGLIHKCSVAVSVLTAIPHSSRCQFRRGTASPHESANSVSSQIWANTRRARAERGKRAYVYSAGRSGRGCARGAGGGVVLAPYNGAVVISKKGPL